MWNNNRSMTLQCCVGQYWFKSPKRTWNRFRHWVEVLTKLEVCLKCRWIRQQCCWQRKLITTTHQSNGLQSNNVKIKSILKDVILLSDSDNEGTQVVDLAMNSTSSFNSSSSSFVFFLKKKKFKSLLHKLFLPMNLLTKLGIWALQKITHAPKNFWFIPI